MSERRVVIETRGNDLDPAYDYDPFVAYAVEGPRVLWEHGVEGVASECTGRTREEAVEAVKRHIREACPHLSFSFFEEHRA